MLKIIAIGISGLMSLFCMIGFYAYQTGIAVIDFRDKVDGRHVFIPVPVGLVNTGLNMLPTEMLQQLSGELGPHHKLIRKLSLELEKVPDGDFVEVTTSREHVLISKSGRNLIIDVDTREQSVYVRVPIRSTGDLIAKIADSAESEY